MLESIYRSAGLRVGLFTSPHLVAFGERIQVNRQLIPEGEVVRLVEEMQPWLKEFHASAHPTFFEVVTIMALRYFAEQRVDLVVWETGLGGRLDATNIVTPLVSVITNIQFDHEKWLGHSLPEIAAEKAGIIKPGIPVITAEDKPEVLEVFSDVALPQRSPLIKVTVADTMRPPLGDLHLPLLGDHQRLTPPWRWRWRRFCLRDSSRRSFGRWLAERQWPGRLPSSIRARTNDHPGRRAQSRRSRGSPFGSGKALPEHPIDSRLRRHAGQRLAGHVPDPGSARQPDLFGSGEQRPRRRPASDAGVLPETQSLGGSPCVLIHERRVGSNRFGFDRPRDRFTPFCRGGDRSLLSAIPSQDERGLNEWTTLR